MASSPAVLVLGGGVAGLAAAQTLDAYGIAVHLVEQGKSLGGRAFQWACMATDTCQNCGACLTAELVEKTADLGKASLYLENSIAGIAKKNGAFTTDLSAAPAEPLVTDAVLLTTGLSPFDASQIEDLRYSEFDQVITTADLNDILKQETLGRVLPPGERPSIAFIQCVGSRDREHGRDYCSQVCCKTAVRQANKILYEIPGADISLFHIDLQVIGKMFRTQATRMADRVTLHQGVPAKILSGREPGKLSVIHEDSATGARSALDFDLIVLAVGIQPAATIGAIADQLGAETDRWGFFGGREAALPQGVYAAGNAMGPCDIIAARDQGIIAAHRIASDLGCLDKSGDALPIAVFGGSSDALQTAQSLAADGYHALLLDPGSQAEPAQAGITYYADVHLTEVRGTMGRYQLIVTRDGQKHSLEAAALVAAGGTEMAPAAEASTSKSIVPLSAFEDAFAKAPDDSPATVAFWLDREGPEWKVQARRCLNLALALVEKGRQAIVVMEKMLVHGMDGQVLYDRARRKGVRFLRFTGPTPVAISPGDNGIRMTVDEATLPGIQLSVDCDVLVLPESIKLPEQLHHIAGVLGQVFDSEGFLQSANVRHRSIASSRRGIFFIGSCHGENDDADLVREIEALKAALALSAIQKFQPAPTPVINEDKCIRCLTCCRICPHAAVDIRNYHQPEIVPRACYGCGLCVSNCPALAIEGTQTLDPAQVKMPDAKTIVIACERSGNPAVKAAGTLGIPDADRAEIIPVPCAGGVDEVVLLKMMARGADRVIVAGCHEGNCRSINGNEYAAAKVDKISSHVGAMDGAVQYHRIAANEPYKIGRIIAETGSAKEKS